MLEYDYDRQKTLSNIFVEMRPDHTLQYWNHFRGDLTQTPTFSFDFEDTFVYCALNMGHSESMLKMFTQFHDNLLAAEKAAYASVFCKNHNRRIVEIEDILDIMSYIDTKRPTPELYLSAHHWFRGSFIEPNVSAFLVDSEDFGENIIAVLAYHSLCKVKTTDTFVVTQEGEETTTTLKSKSDFLVYPSRQAIYFTMNR